MVLARNTPQFVTDPKKGINMKSLTANFPVSARLTNNIWKVSDYPYKHGSADKYTLTAGVINNAENMLSHSTPTLMQRSVAGKYS